MPARKIMELYREGKLHSGKGGPIVKSPAQAKAIQISEARAEVHRIPYPKKKSFAHRYKDGKDHAAAG